MPVKDGLRRCSDCLEWKPESEFKKNKSRSTGVSSSCKPCDAVRYDRWRRKNMDRLRAYRTEWEARGGLKPKTCRAAAKSRMRAPGRNEHYSPAELRELIVAANGRCYYCGEPSDRMEVDHKVPLSRGGANDISNICLCCRTCNRRKARKTEDEFRQLAGRA